MLSFALEYRTAIEALTSERKNDLRQFELSEEEWEIVQELSDTLKVGPCVCGSVWVHVYTSHATLGRVFVGRVFNRSSKH